MDDKFLPPKSNFVSVGHTDHAWYDESVTGPSERMVDNNENVDIENLQRVSVVDKDNSVFGVGGSPDPLAQSDVRKRFETRLNHIFESLKSQLEMITAIDDLNSFMTNVRSKKGVLGTLLKQFADIPEDEKESVGEMIDQQFQQFNLEFRAKEQELNEDAEETEADPVDDEIDEGEESYEPDGSKEYVSDVSQLDEGQYGIFIKEELFNTSDTAEEARQVLTRLVLGNNVELSDIKVFKRVSVDFGILFRED
jgi:hypothetical protein